ncbi:hypothetical protein ACFL0H_02195 [Thermodesulfobacteriota bacterium]
MAWQTLKDKQKIIQLIKDMIIAKKEVNIRIDGDKKEFTSRIIKITLDSLSSSTSKRSAITIEKLQPDKGNTFIRSASEIILGFIINDKHCRCRSDYIDISSTPPYFGFFLTIPETIDIQEKRYKDRVYYETPDFVSAEFRLGKGAGEKMYELNVIDCSIRGLGLIITKDDFDLIEKLKIGDKIEDILFFATWTMLKVNATVKHITKIGKGKYKGNYQLGIESQEIIDSCKPEED